MDSGEFVGIHSVIFFDHCKFMGITYARYKDGILRPIMLAREAGWQPLSLFDKLNKRRGKPCV